MIGIKTAFKYKTPFKGPYEIFQTWKNVSVILQKLLVTTRVNIRRIKPSKNNTEEVSVFNQYKR